MVFYRNCTIVHLYLCHDVFLHLIFIVNMLRYTSYTHVWVAYTRTHSQIKTSTHDMHFIVYFMFCKTAKLIFYAIKNKTIYYIRWEIFFLLLVRDCCTTLITTIYHKTRAYTHTTTHANIGVLLFAKFHQGLEAFLSNTHTQNHVKHKILNYRFGLNQFEWILKCVCQVWSCLCVCLAVCFTNYAPFFKDFAKGFFTFVAVKTIRTHTFNWNYFGY